MSNRYPKAEWLGNGRTYGPLPDAGPNPNNPSEKFTTDDIRLVYHTTETTVLPGYGGGDVAPHYTYDPARRKWYGHAELDRRVGTMRGFSSTGVRCNEISVQVEIICYSDKSIADGSSSRLWVGDFTDDHYADLAEFAAWVRDAWYPGIDGRKWYGPPMFSQFMYGTSANTRMNTADWYQFGGGITAHGGASGQSHWDTGVMDMKRIADEMQEEPLPPPVELQPGIYFVELGDGTEQQRPELKAAVQFWQQALFRMNLMPSPINGEYDRRTADAVKQCNNRFEGEKIDYLNAHWILRKWMQFEAELLDGPS